jgi:hypothetical protein
MSEHCGEQAVTQLFHDDKFIKLTVRNLTQGSKLEQKEAAMILSNLYSWKDMKEHQLSIAREHHIVDSIVSAFNSCSTFLAEELLNLVSKVVGLGNTQLIDDII